MIGKTISHYKILEKLGEGGMGVVYKAQDTKLKRHVALKFLPPELTRDKEAKDRFIHEARAAAGLDHNNICAVYEIDETKDGQMYIAMACYDGVTLKEKIEKGPLKLDEAIDIAIQVAQGLERAHESNIIHRDIKSANIFITPRDEVKIIDFGLAKLKGQTKLTKEGTTLGTVAYMSPEQTSGEDVDNRSDIWSLGVLLYEMLAGQLPFRGEYEQAVMYSIMNEDPEPVTEVRPEVPVTLGQAVSRALEKDPDKRYQHIDELLDDLRSLSEGIVPEEIRARLLKAKLRKRKKKILYSTVVVLIIAIAVIALWKLIPQKATIAPRIKNSIAVISFENLTGDESQDILERIIPNLLITNLENTGFFYVATWDRLRDLMKQVGKEDEETIDKNLGFELCRREGIRAIVLGSVMKVGDVFATDVKVFDVETEKLLKSARSEGVGINSIIKTQIDELSREISLGVGIKKGDVASADFNISEFTTTSVEAFNYFIRGREDFYDQYTKEAIIRFNKAIELDPNFAMAYLFLGLTYNNLVLDYKKAREYTKKAKTLSGSVTEKEKLLIEAEYARFVERKEEKWLDIIKKIARKFPREKHVHLLLSAYYRRGEMYPEVKEHAGIVLALDPHRGDAYQELAFAYANTGDDGKAMAYIRKGLAAVPGDASMNLTAGQFYIKAGKIDEAIRKFKDALDIKPDFTIENFLAYAYAMKEDYAEAIHWCGKFTENPLSEGLKAKGYWFRGFYHFWLGNSTQAIKDLQTAWDIIDASGDRDYMSEFLMGYFYYEKGEWNLSRKYIQGWHDGLMKPLPESAKKERSMIASPVHWVLGLIDVKQGNFSSARSHLKEMKALPPRRSTSGSSGYYVLLGEILLAEKAYDEAISELKDIEKRKMPWIWNTRFIFGFNMQDPEALLAKAYKEKGDLDKAIEVYARLTDPNPENRDGRMINPRNYYHLAECYEMKGWKGKAIDSYKKFIDLWKNCDPQFKPLVEDARKRVQELEGKK